MKTYHTPGHLPALPNHRALWWLHSLLPLTPLLPLKLSQPPSRHLFLSPSLPLSPSFPLSPSISLYFLPLSHPLPCSLTASLSSLSLSLSLYLSISPSLWQSLPLSSSPSHTPLPLAYSLSPPPHIVEYVIHSLNSFKKYCPRWSFHIFHTYFQLYHYYIQINTAKPPARSFQSNVTAAHSINKYKRKNNMLWICATPCFNLSSLINKSN